MTMRARDIADYFITLVDEDTGEVFTNLKLQKLVYYAQGFHLALYDKPLFNERIEAWLHGPVVPELYQIYKGYKSQPVPVSEGFDVSQFTEEVKELLNEVNLVYGQYSAWRLRDMTYEELPWQESYKKIDKTISHESLKSFFKDLIH